MSMSIPGMLFFLVILNLTVIFWGFNNVMCGNSTACFVSLGLVIELFGLLS